MLLFTNMKLSCKHASDGFSTWAKFDGYITKHSSALYIIGMAKVLPIIDVLGYDGQNSSFSSSSSCSDSTPITQKGSHVSP